MQGREVVASYIIHHIECNHQQIIAEKETKWFYCENGSKHLTVKFVKGIFK